MLIPVSDEALVTVSKNKSVLENDFIVACTDWQITQKIVEKKYTYQLAEKIGIPSPKTLFPKSVEEALDFGDSIGYPCLVKPSQSHQYFAIFNRKMVKVKDSIQLEHAYREASDCFLEVFLQEYYRVTVRIQ